MYSFWIDKKWLRLTFLALMAVLERFWNAFRLYIYIYCIRCQVEQTKAPCEGQARESANCRWLLIATYIYIYIWYFVRAHVIWPCKAYGLSCKAQGCCSNCCRVPFATWSDSFRPVSDLFETIAASRLFVVWHDGLYKYIYIWIIYIIYINYIYICWLSMNIATCQSHVIWTCVHLEVRGSHAAVHYKQFQCDDQLLIVRNHIIQWNSFSHVLKSFCIFQRKSPKKVLIAPRNLNRFLACLAVLYRFFLIRVSHLDHGSSPPCYG